ncbi:MAG: hypothetical protein ACLFSB_16285 [Chitinispirillaceae bacterium]
MIIKENKLVFDKSVIVCEKPILEAQILEKFIIILLDPDAYTKKTGQFNNLLAYSHNGKLMWKAELPTNQPGDRYYQISSYHPLTASSIFSYTCEIDISTGKIKNRKFYK